MADYDHSHIVFAGYLKQWAVDNRLAMRLTDRPERIVRPSPRDAGVRSGFTRERLADGTYINRLDPAFGELEGIALPFLLEMDDLWPMTGDHRGRVAELLAIQVLRSPAYRAFHRQAVPNARASVQPEHPQAEERHFDAVEKHLLTDTERHGRMLWQSSMLATIMANMHWTLLRASRPRLVTSDHPVVAVPMSDGATRVPIPIPPGGLVNTLEFRFAVRPDLLLVMSWHDAAETNPRSIAVHHIRNHNSLVIAQADRQWFHHPEIQPAYSPGDWHPISRDLHPGYGPRVAHRSQRWATVHGLIDEPIRTGTRMKQIAFKPWVDRAA